MHAEAGCTGDRWPLVLPSHIGKLVAPDLELVNSAHLRLCKQTL